MIRSSDWRRPWTPTHTAALTQFDDGHTASNQFGIMETHPYHKVLPTFAATEQHDVAEPGMQPVPYVVKTPQPA